MSSCGEINANSVYAQGDDKIQNFLYHTSKADVSTRVPDVGSAGARIGSRSDMQELYNRLRLLGGLLFSSPEFRKMISDFSGKHFWNRPRSFTNVTENKY